MAGQTMRDGATARPRHAARGTRPAGDRTGPAGDRPRPAAPRPRSATILGLLLLVALALGHVAGHHAAAAPATIVTAGERPSSDGDTAPDDEETAGVPFPGNVPAEGTATPVAVAPEDAARSDRASGGLAWPGGEIPALGGPAVVGLMLLVLFVATSSRRQQDEP